jgi:large subunit ribosomal protein L24
VEVPSWMLSADDTDKRPVRSMEKPVSLNSIRVVHPINIPGQGVKDVIVKKMTRINTRKDEATGKVVFERCISGFRHAIIPLPESEPETYKDFDADTLRIDVEQKTFVPTLLRPPIPIKVIDELRNKFSVFRTRHDPEYIAAKMEEERLKEEKKKSVKEMLTPLKEANRLERKLKRAQGKGKLTQKMLLRIGQAIAEKRGLSFELKEQANVA